METLRRTFPIAVFALALLCGGPLAASADAGAATLSCNDTSRFMGAYLKGHIRYRRIDPEIETRTIDTYLRRIDPSRTVLLESEVEVMRKSLAGALGKVRENSCEFLEKIHADLVAQQQEVEDFVRAYTAVKESEVATFLQVISSWEREYLLLNV